MQSAWMQATEFTAIRNRLGHSQAALAALLGVDQATVSRWESGKARIPATVELALATLKENRPMPTRRILVTDPVAEEGVAILRNAGEVDVRLGLKGEELISAIRDYDALVVRSETKVTREVIEAAAKLQVIGRAGVGVDNIDLQAATERGVIVVNAPQGNTIAVAEHTIGLLLGLARHITRADASTRAGEWRRKDFLGVEVRDRVLGIVGFGKIGQEVARRALGLEMRILALDPFVPDERVRTLGAEPATFDRIIEESDFISVHTPLTASTSGLIGAAEMARMKDGVRLINVARGGIIDEQALSDAIASGKVGGAAIDVFAVEPLGESPLKGDPRIILTPHLGASTAEAQEKVAVDVAEQIVDIFADRPARYAVNAPMLGAETLKVIGPYMDVASTIGNIATQLVRGTVESIEIDYYGEIAEHDVTPLRAGVIAGLMRPISEETINVVNASLVAQTRGWNLEERLRSSHGVFVNLIRINVKTSEEAVSVGGTIQHGVPHIVVLNDLDVDLTPEPNTFLLACDNEDRPGMIGRLGTLLGSWDINIRAMDVSRRERRGRALMLLSLDECPDDEQVRAIEDIDGIYNVRVVRWS